MNAIQYWPVRIKGDVTVCVQPLIQQMSSYILLEQEDWFEDEMEFIRSYITPEMNAFDVGANHGVYALSIGKKLTTGHVWAFEPTLSPGSMLAKSIELNACQKIITWVHAGLSDHPHQAEIVTSINSELNSLYAQNGIKETIRLEALDNFIQLYSINVVIDFVKLDAEGEEINVLRGGQKFFTAQSPLLMFELKHGNKVNHGLIEAIQDLGYKIYRLLPDLNILIDYDQDFKDGYLLNLFACKSDRAAQLTKRGLLASKSAITALNSEKQVIHLNWLEKIKEFPFAKLCIPTWQTHLNSIPKKYLAALSACLQSYDVSKKPAERIVLLEIANHLVEEISQNLTHPPLAVQLLRLHLLHSRGYRSAAVALSQSIINISTKFNLADSWPFIPPCGLFFERIPQKSIDEWLLSTVKEFHEYRRSFSSYFVNEPLKNLRPLLNNPNVGQAIERRLLLAGQKSTQPFNIAHDHALLNPAQSVNALIWQQVIYGISPILVSINSPIHILDIGASTHGKLTEPYAPLMQMGLAKVTGFEPNQVECQKLNDMYLNNQKYHYYPEFVGNGSEATFYETNWFMTGSLYKPNSYLLNQFEQLGEVVKLQAEHSVKTIRIADLENLDEIDMIKIDVQGAELDVFKGAAERLNQVLVIWTEVEFMPLYENQPLFSEVEQYLRQQNFMFHSFNGIASRSYKPYSDLVKKRLGIRQAIWSDAIFIRNLNHLKNLSTVKLKKFAAILDSVLKSYDVCFLILQLIDQRENTQLAQIYLNRRNIN
jgi:protein O-GlcNAc transferase